MSKKIKKPWPTKAAMAQIYEKHLWGGEGHDFYSGSGSHDITITRPYLEAVIAFLKSHKRLLSICDLGCGDFNIGFKLVPFSRKYIAVDIVETLTTRNQLKYQAPHLEFECLDIAKDNLPKADCTILRQVLQHLSNAEILNVCSKLEQYKYLILTEHVPKKDFTPNKDIISGQGIRLKHHSGVNLLAPPFNFKVKAKHLLHIHNLAHNKECIATYLYEI